MKLTSDSDTLAENKVLILYISLLYINKHYHILRISLL